MSGKQLNRIGNFLKYWKNCVLFYGYNDKGIECFFIKKGDSYKEIPYSSEYICENGCNTAWSNMKQYLSRNDSIAYDAVSDLVLSKEN